jgi:hypothetical protein
MEMRNVYPTLLRKPEGNKPIGRTIQRWKGNITMELKEFGMDSSG